MIGAFPADLKVVVASKPIDFRKGVNGLVALVADALKADPYCGDVFVFRSKRSDRLKILAWDGSGLILAADSDDAAQLFRDDRAHHSEMMPPIRGVVVGVLI